MKKSQILILAAALLLTACGEDKTTAANSVGADSGAAAQTYFAELPEEAEEAGIFVAPIEGVGSDFIRGMDVSSVLAEEQSGVVYKDWDGNEKDLFQILADAGINYIRVRVWNDPYDADGHGYGGGNSDVEKAGVIGRRAAECGMKLLVDFHYSDFWADPNKQYAPAEWARKKPEQKAELMEEYTRQSILSILAAGGDVGMVQIGNEINNGLCGVYEQEQIMELLKSASAGVRAAAAESERDIKVVVHYTQLDDPEGTMRRAALLESSGVDYDVFGESYYPYWHGSLDNMESLLKQVSDTYGKETMICETAYLWTEEDGDGFGNSVSAADTIEAYPATPQGQAKLIRDVAEHAYRAGAIGIFYWEGAWVSVGSDYAANQALWEEYGSGWASSYSAAYDPKDAGQYYGGCSWDNQAMFDFTGKALESLKVFRWLEHGATAPLAVLAYKDVRIESGIGGELVMPGGVEVYYNDPSVQEEMPVTWDLSHVDVDTAAVYEVPGLTKSGDEILATVKIMNINYLENAGFEEADMSMWEVEDKGSGDATDVQTKASDALSGEKAFHFYSTEDIDFELSQELTASADGEYSAVANIQGGDVGADAVIELVLSVNGEEYRSEPAKLGGWQQWQRMEVNDVSIAQGDSIVFAVRVRAAAKGWGTIDDLELYREQNE